MGTDEGSAGDATTAPRATQTIGFDLIKGNYFRVIFADGAFGGLSPTGMINVSFFNERFPLPKHIEHQISPDGHVGPEVSREARGGIVREVEAEIVLTLSGARLLRDWLGTRIVELESVHARQAQEEKS